MIPAEPQLAERSASAESTRDFGGLVRGKSQGLVEPASSAELAGLVQIARRSGQRLTLRGRGWSQSGQSVPDDSLLVSFSKLCGVSPPDPATSGVLCEAGATFRELAQACAAVGWMPRVLPLNLDLTVGGVLAAGGFGSNSHRWGPVVSQVLSAEVVLGTGEIVESGPRENRAVYDAVLGGVGRCGAVTSARLAVEPVSPYVRTFYLVYDELGQLIEDALRVQHSADHLEAFCSPSVQGLCRAGGGGRKPLFHWLYGLHVSVNCQQPQDVAADRLLSPLRYPRLIHDDYDSPLNFAARYDARFDAMRASGAWVQAHPWFEALLPLDALEGFVHQALALLPPFFGGGHRILFHPQLDRPKALAFPREPAAGFAILPEGIPEPVVPKSLEVLRQLDDLVQQLGGKRYLSGFLFDMGRAGWQRHYQGNYEGLRRAKHEFDPDDVFGSRLAPLA